MDSAERNVAMIERGARGLLRLEFVLLAAIYFYFVISDRTPLVAWIVIALIWIARVTTQGIRRTPFDLPIVILLALLPVSLAVSTNWSLSVPKVYGVVLSALFFYALVNQVATRDDLNNTMFWLVVVFAAIALAGIIGTDWAQNKIVSATWLYDRLPRFIQGIPRSIAGGFARNGVGGTLALTIPFLAALASQYSVFRVQYSVFSVQYSDKKRLNTEYWTLNTVVLVALVLSLVALALTQSRGGMLGTAVGLLAIAIWRERRFAWLIVAGALALGVLFALGYGDALLAFILRMDAGAGTFASRLEVWSRGVMMVQDFPYTGIGIGTYNDLAHALYPFFIAAPDEVVAHAHNNFLQVAVDLGIPGLIAYTALMTLFVILAWRAYRALPEARALIVGVSAGMLAHQVFGLTDAFMLGTKPGVLMWIFLALVAALDRQRVMDERT
ncbi:MAG: O-antigen ligase family protein [Chloroflexi bacterium]|nr:O-antigen ligase family protein [Chloroflexota bacterium]